MKFGLRPFWAKPRNLKASSTEAHSASAHQAAKPQSRRTTLLTLLVRIHFQIIKIDFRQGIAENSRRALPIWNRVDAFDHPRRRFSFANGPDFSTRAGFAVGKILN